MNVQWISKSKTLEGHLFCSETPSECKQQSACKAATHCFTIQTFLGQLCHFILHYESICVKLNYGRSQESSESVSVIALMFSTILISYPGPKRSDVLWGPSSPRPCSGCSALTSDKQRVLSLQETPRTHDCVFRPQKSESPTNTHAQEPHH